MTILISTAQELQDINNNLTADYKLANDIDMDGFEWIPIGDATNRFRGKFDGKGYKISNLTYNNTSTTNVGLFGLIDGATIQNVGVENVNFNARLTGGLVAQAINSTITNCYTTGQINSATSYAGGLVGTTNNSTITNCYSAVTVYSSNTSTSSSNGGVGGLIGRASNVSTITNCYSRGHVSNYHNTASGLIGYVTSSDLNTIVNNSYWDVDTSGLNTSQGGGVGKTTQQMQTQSTYQNWDFTNVWYMNEYPELRVFEIEKEPINRQTVNVNSYLSSIHSNLSNSKQSTIELKSYTRPIFDSLRIRRSVLRSAETYLSSLHSNVLQSHITLNKATRQIDSYSNPIFSKVATLYPVKDVSNFGLMLAIENNSTIFNHENISQLSYIINPSIVEVI
ncbi:GLUG motif-containing protein [Rummeliibacillus suwonensis]|uniref:GLUG motif-containing protein n=1 Tax=Rummeliibacillus suwonensis TaxID=1306154 RepID=UPI00289F4B7D|nr:GLUG motif-containing protein [Rummeliibacillus suwonensis]